MTCQEIHALLSPSLDDALDAADEARLWSHVARCRACAARLDRLRAGRDVFRRAAPGRASRRARRRSNSGSSSRPMAATAAAVGLIVLALVFTRAPAPERSSTANDLVSMEFPAAEVRALPPCYLPSDCGLEAEAVSR